MNNLIHYYYLLAYVSYIWKMEDDYYDIRQKNEYLEQII